MLPGSGDRQIGEKLVIAFGQLMTARHELIQAIHLAVAKSGLQLGHAVIEAQVDLLVVPGAVRLMSHQTRITGDAMALSRRYS